MKLIRPTQVILLLILLFMIGCLYLWIIPLVNTNHPVSPFVLALHQRLLTPIYGVQMITVIIICSFLLMCLVIDVETRTRKRITHGSSHHANGKEIRPYVHRAGSFLRLPIKSLQGQHTIPESLLHLGRYQRKNITLSEHQQESNVLLTAPIGKGKTARIIIPNLLQECGSRSLFIADVKGELVKKTAGTVSQSHDVWVFAPANPEQSEQYNPLAFINTYEDADAFATCWVNNTGKSGNDEFWEKAATRVLRMAMLHLCITEPHAPFRRLADIVHTPYYEMKQTLTTSPSPRVRKDAIPFFDSLDKNPRLMGSVMADVGTRLGMLNSGEIQAVTARNEIDFRAMAERPIALYLSIPTRYQSTYQPLLACFMMQMFTTWEERAERETTGRLPRRIMCYLDEFANLGYISNLSSYISTARSSGVGMLIVLQSFSQIVDKYSKSVLQTLLTNTVHHLLLPGAGREETEYYSARIGTTTTQTHSRNTRGTGSFFGDAEERWTKGEAARRLMTPDELRTMADDQMLLLGSSSAPMILTTKPYFEDPKMMKLVNCPFNPVHTYKKPEETPQVSPGVPKTPPQAVESGPKKKANQDQTSFFFPDDD